MELRGASPAAPAAEEAPKIGLSHPGQKGQPMVRRAPPYKPDTKAEREYPHLQALFRLLHELAHESPRGAVLLCLSHIDDLLVESITNFLIQGKSTKRLLEGFSAP